MRSRLLFEERALLKQRLNQGHVTQHQYDLSGREISVTMAYGQVARS